MATEIPPTENSKTERTQSTNEAPSNPPVISTADSGKQKHSDETQCSKGKRGHDCFERTSLAVSIVLCIATIAAASFAGWLAFVTHRMARDARTTANRQFAEIESEQRPWLRFEARLTGLQFAKNGDASIMYFGTYKNVGKTPAQNVHVRVIGAVLTKATAFSSVNEEMAQCRLAATDGKFSSAFPGIVLFPDEVATRIIGGTGIGSAGISAKDYRKAWPGADDLIFKLVGCIDYALSQGRGRHGQTGFSYQISQREGEAHIKGVKPVPNTLVPLETLVFESDPWGSGYIR
jgi:hypothetical protein